jgi:hypothetical protein
MGTYTDIYDIVLNNKLNFAEIEKNVKKYKNILDTIQKIDYDAYFIEVNTILNKFSSALKELICVVKSNKKIELVEYYDKIYREILKPYFGEFVPQEYPPYLKDHVINLIKDDFDNKKIQIQLITDNCNILKKIDMFKKNTISSVFNKINTNCYKEQTLFTNDKCEYIELIILLKDCERLEINISPFIRFVLINLYNEVYEDNNLCQKEMFFRKHGEIPMYTYITHTLHLSRAINMDINLYVFGLDSIDFTTDDFILENYYIEYEKKNNKINFVNM